MLHRTQTLFRLIAFLCLVCYLGMAAPRAQDETGGEADFMSTLEESDEREDSKDPGESTGMLMLKMFLTLGLVLAIMAGLAWLWKRYGPDGAGIANQGRSEAIRVVGTKMLGGKRTLLLVRVRGQTLLLGATPQQITCLSEIEELDNEWSQPATTEPGSKAFEKQLGRFVRQVVQDEEKQPPASES